MIELIKNKRVIVILVSLLVYSIVLALFGVFGATIQSYVKLALSYVIPAIGIAFGYFMCVFVPLRVFEALRIRHEKEVEDKKQETINQQLKMKKSLEQKILETLSKEETTR